MTREARARTFRCPRCRRWRFRQAFTGHHRNGMQGYCRPCMRKYNAARRLLTEAKLADNATRRRRRASESSDMTSRRRAAARRWWLSANGRRCRRLDALDRKLRKRHDL